MWINFSVKRGGGKHEDICVPCEFSPKGDLSGEEF